MTEDLSNVFLDNSGFKIKHKKNLSILKGFLFEPSSAEKEGFCTLSEALFLLGFSSPIKIDAPKYAPPF